MDALAAPRSFIRAMEVLKGLKSQFDEQDFEAIRQRVIQELVDRKVNGPPPPATSVLPDTQATAESLRFVQGEEGSDECNSRKTPQFRGQ